MPIGPKGQKRPADVISNAVKVMRIATGEESDPFADNEKNPAAVTLGRMGGAARAKSLSTDEMIAIAKKGAAVRWKTKARKKR